MGPSAMGLPAAGRAHVSNEISDRTDVLLAIIKTAKVIYNVVQVSLRSCLSNIIWKVQSFLFRYGIHLKFDAVISYKWLPPPTPITGAVNASQAVR